MPASFYPLLSHGAHQQHSLTCSRIAIASLPAFALQCEQHNRFAVSDGVLLQREVKMHCKHAYTEHIRGRMLHFKVSFDAGSGRSRRTIGQAALPLMSVLPKKEDTPSGWPQGYSHEAWPFSVPLYHGCALLRISLNMSCASRETQHMKHRATERCTLACATCLYFIVRV